MAATVRPVEVRDSVREDIARVLADIHPLDVEELQALGHTVEHSLTFGFEQSEVCQTFFLHGEIGGMIGVVRAAEGVGCLWLMTTNAVSRYPKPFVIYSHRYMDELRGRYRHLENRIDARNTRLVNWVQSLGFTLDEPEPYGPQGVPFIRYHWSADVHRA